MYPVPPIRTVNPGVGSPPPPPPPRSPCFGREALCSSQEGVLQQALRLLRPPRPVPSGATPVGRWEPLPLVRPLGSGKPDPLRRGWVARAAHQPLAQNK